MYSIKQKNEDFIVKEIAEHEIIKEGRFALCILKKKDYTTQRAVDHLCSHLNLKEKMIGYAGLKDRHAITYQYITIEGKTKERIKSINLKDIEVEFLGYSDKKIFLGDLKGNEFEIIVRNIDKLPCPKEYFPNLFGEQRFSLNNVEVGRCIVKKKFSEAVNSMIKTEGDYEEKVKGFLAKNPTNHIGALRTVPLRILKLYIHSYQSYLWNKAVIKSSFDKNLIIKMPGFGVEYDNSPSGIIMKEILKEEQLNERDFIIPQFPELSIEGEERKAFIRIENLIISEPEIDEFNDNKNKIKIKFFLPKGSYATVAVFYLFN